MKAPLWTRTLLLGLPFFLVFCLVFHSFDWSLSFRLISKWWIYLWTMSRIWRWQTQRSRVSSKDRWGLFMMSCGITYIFIALFRWLLFNVFYMLPNFNCIILECERTKLIQYFLFAFQHHFITFILEEGYLALNLILTVNFAHCLFSSFSPITCTFYIYMIITSVILNWIISARWALLVKALKLRNTALSNNT